MNRNRRRRILKRWFFSWILTTSILVVGGGGFFPENEITTELRGMIAKYFPPEIIQPMNAYMEAVGVEPLPNSADIDSFALAASQVGAAQPQGRKQQSRSSQAHPKPDDHTVVPIPATQLTQTAEVAAALGLTPPPVSISGTANPAETFVIIPGGIKRNGPKEYEKPVVSTPTPTVTGTATQTLMVKSPTADTNSTQAATPTSPPTASATFTALPTNTSTPLPTATFRPWPTFTPTPRNTRPPDPTDTPTPLPTATDTPIPSDTDTPTNTAAPTNTPTITATPLPSATPLPPNQPPVAVSDSATTVQGNSITVLVLFNDHDPDGDALSITRTTDGANGSVSDNGSSVTYTPNAGFTGTDSFTYTISDGRGGRDTATVRITVVP